MLRKLSLFISLSLLVFSCSNDKNMMEEEISISATELSTILNTDDITSVADNVLAQLYTGIVPSGKTAKFNDCYTAEYTETGFTATFNNCVIDGVEGVTGTLEVTYNVNSQMSSFTTTYSNFNVGGIQLNGTRTIDLSGNTEGNSVLFSITSEIDLIMVNGDVVSEMGTKDFSYNFSGDIANSNFTLQGSWTFLVNDDTYKVNTTTPLVGSLTCANFTTGIMSVDKNGLRVLVDLGDGICDNLATLTYPNGTIQEITLKK